MISILRHLRSLSRSERGNVALLSALAMPVVLGSLGLGAEVASWYGGKRSLQNAADSAAIAAATNASDNYANEARAVAARYGFEQGVDGVTITSVNNAACPDGENVCYKVTITRPQALMLAQVVGVQGDVQFNGAPAKVIKASALAIRANVPREYCVTALVGSGASQGIDTNGAPSGNMAGCNMMSNTNATCTGHDLDADYVDAHGVNDGCGNKRTSHVDPVSDIYEGLKDNIPSDPCNGSYPMTPRRKSDPPLPSSNHLQGLEPRSVIEMCGDVELSGPTIINSGGNTVLYIRNGSLNVKSYKLETQAGSSLTVVFTGNDESRDHIPIGNGALDFAAPTTGPWKGMAIYQDPRMTGQVDVREAGNAPTWALTGMVYMPHAAVTLSGSVNKASNGASCFGLVVDHLRVNGTAEILAHGQCPAAGVVLPTSMQPGRGQLVG